jgi:hypothetical protein
MEGDVTNSMAMDDRRFVAGHHRFHFLTLTSHGQRSDGHRGYVYFSELFKDRPRRRCRVYSRISKTVSFRNDRSVGRN